MQSTSRFSVLSRVLTVLNWLTAVLNIPLMITGVAAFFGYNLDIAAVRSALEFALPDHVNELLRGLSPLHYFFVFLYVANVLGWLYLPDLGRETSSDRPPYTPRILKIVMFVNAMALALALPLLFGPILSAALFFPECAVGTVAECVDVAIKDSDLYGLTASLTGTLLVLAALFLPMIVRFLMMPPRQTEGVSSS